jgi:hypothetical protein
MVDWTSFVIGSFKVSSLDTNRKNNDLYTICNRKCWIAPPSHKIKISDAMRTRSDINNVRLCVNIVHVMNVDDSSFGWGLGRNSEIIRIRRAPS